MPFVVCPSCNQHNFSSSPERATTRKCTRCGQVFWIKTADRGAGAHKALVDRAATALGESRGPRAA
jgi:hypothetical protein